MQDRYFQSSLHQDSNFTNNSSYPQAQTPNISRRIYNAHQGSNIFLGNSSPEYTKKSINPIYGVPDDFIPKYPEKAANERKAEELYNGFSPMRVIKRPEKRAVTNVTAKDRKMQDRASVLDSHSYDCYQTPEKHEGKKPRYDPNSRKQEHLTSSVFGSPKNSECGYSVQSRDEENIEERRKNHLYSDIFYESPIKTYRPTERPSSAQKTPRFEYNPISQHQRLFDTSNTFYDPSQQNERTRPVTPTLPSSSYYLNYLPHPSYMKQQELSTIFTSTPNLPNPEIHECKLSNIPKNFNEKSFKNVFQGFHIVNFSLDIDNFTGECRGTGLAKIRCHFEADLGKLFRVCGEQGIFVELLGEDAGKKSEFTKFYGESWEKRENLVGREAKMKNLGSSIFEEKYEWNREKIPSVNEDLKRSLQWNRIKGSK